MGNNILQPFHHVVHLCLGNDNDNDNDNILFDDNIQIYTVCRFAIVYKPEYESGLETTIKTN